MSYVSDVEECRAIRPVGSATVILSQTRATPDFIRIYADRLPAASEQPPEMRVTLDGRLLLAGQMTARPIEGSALIDAGRGFPEADVVWLALGQADTLSIEAGGATLLTMPVADAASLRDLMARCLTGGADV
ncbi:hypothetical protein HKCCE3408_06000 [Rhodobacterales bacterium HKCCE3408]|nr:hypothetical protein [Rhodobacterales bacterium HKCCE3408]